MSAFLWAKSFSLSFCDDQAIDKSFFLRRLNGRMLFILPVGRKLCKQEDQAPEGSHALFASGIDARSSIVGM